MRFIPGGDREHLHAQVGDRLVIEGGALRPRRQAVILEVHGDEGAPPYVVRWTDGSEGAVFPGPDAHIEPAAIEPSADEAAAESV
jgi:uncharacterized protein DUF1918